MHPIDAQYGKFATVREVAKALRDKEEPTLQQWSSAVARTTPPNLYATGGGWNRDLLKAATVVGKATIPHTGATGAGTVGPIMRGLEGVGGALFGAGALHHPLAALGAAGTLGSLYGAYSPIGVRALAGQTGWQQGLQGLLRNVSPAAKEAIGRYGRAGLLSGLLDGQQQPGGLLAAPSP